MPAAAVAAVVVFPVNSNCLRIVFFVSVSVFMSSHFLLLLSYIISNIYTLKGAFYILYIECISIVFESALALFFVIFGCIVYPYKRDLSRH